MPIYYFSWTRFLAGRFAFWSKSSVREGGENARGLRKVPKGTFQRVGVINYNPSEGCCGWCGCAAGVVNEAQMQRRRYL